MGQIYQNNLSEMSDYVLCFWTSNLKKPGRWNKTLQQSVPPRWAQMKVGEAGI